MIADTLGNRMKENYEYRYRNYFPNRLPIIIRVDGKAFHSYTNGLNRPFDELFISAMQQTAFDLVKNIEGCKLGYVQSDEISLLLMNDDSLKTQPWFDNNISKIISVSASMATLYFNNNFQKLKNKYLAEHLDFTETDTYCSTLLRKDASALFDSRAFILPKEEVNNYFYWRQLDATRNSILSCAQTYLGKSNSKGFKCNQLQDKMFTEKDFNWDSLPIVKKRGTCIIYRPINILKINKDGTETPVTRNKPIIDVNIPIFSQDPNYINNIVFHKKEDK